MLQPRAGRQRMRRDDPSKNRIDPHRLRILMLVPFLWLVVASLLPEFYFRLIDWNSVLLTNITAGIGVVLVSIFTAYLLIRIRRDRRLILVVLFATALLLASQTFRMLRALDMIDGLLRSDWGNPLRSLDNLLNGLGLVLLALAFTYTIIELLATRQRLMDECRLQAEEAAQRRTVEESLRENEAMLHAISASALDAIILMDNAGLIYYWNPSAERILGYTAAEILGKPVHTLLAPDRYRAEYTAGLGHWRPSGKGPVIGKTLALIARRKDGREIEVDLSVSSVQIRNQWYAVGILRDVTERNRIEAEAIETRQRYVDLVNNLPVAVYRNTPGPEGRFIEMNPAHVAMFEADSKEQLMQCNVSDLYYNSAQRRAISEKLTRNGFIQNEEILLRTLKGRPMWALVSAVIKKDRDGALFFDGILQDITELRQAEQEYQIILKTSLSGYWAVDPDGRILDVNEAYCRMSGYTREELLTMRVHDIDVLEDAAAAAAHIARIRELRGDRFETRHRTKDGAIIDIDASVNPLEGKSTKICAFFRDITERKRAEAALKASEARYRDLVQSANTIIMRLDLQGQVRFVNSFAQKFFGYTEEQLLGRSILGTILPEGASAGEDLFALLHSSGTHPNHYLNSEYENLRSDETRVWVAWTSTPVYDEQGRTREVLCVGNDVTEKRRAERIIAEHQIRMVHTSRLSALGTMAGGIAHEINNPLATISVAAQQLESFFCEERPGSTRAVHATKTIGRNVERISRIVRGLLTLSRDGAQDPFSTASVSSLLSDTLELCQARFAAHNIALLYEPPPEALELECRPAQISQILINLLNNAHDAIEDVPEKWIRIEVQDAGESILLTVTDSGRGLPIEVREKVLLPFFTTKDPGRGVGLGLSISLRLAEAHHGELSLDPACPNTRFVVRLPKRQPDGAPAEGGA